MLLYRKVFGMFMIATTASAALAVEYHGYLRSGLGASQHGADQACYSAPGTTVGKARLGNECETYGEVTFSELLKSEQSPVVFKTVLTLSLASAGHKDWESTQTRSTQTQGSTEIKTEADFTLALREAYVQGDNIFATYGPKLWAGKRFYRRKDIHMFDFYYLANTGPGVGIEDIELGPGRFHLALTRLVQSAQLAAQNNIDLRWSDIELSPASKLELVGIVGSTGTRSASGEESFESQSGYQASAILSTSVFGGSNEVILQYGTGLYGGDSVSRSTLINNHAQTNEAAIAKDDESRSSKRELSSTVRAIEHYSGPITPELSAEFMLLYQDIDFAGQLNPETQAKAPNKSETVVGVRPVYALSYNTALAFEYAYTNIANAQYNKTKARYTDSVLQKVTIAPQITAGPGYFARPQLRVFATYANWNKDSGKIDGMNSRSNMSVGTQVEAWW